MKTKPFLSWPLWLLCAVALSAPGAAIGGTRPGRHFDRYHNHYRDSFVTKIFMKHGGPVGQNTPTTTTMDQVRELIRNAHEISGGMHQIVYLVGAMDRGLDSGYPCWTNVNASCKSSLSDDPLTSIRMAMREAREKYNCDLTFHLNTSDAEEDSLDWRRCLEKDVICRNADGSLKKSGAHWYLMSHAKDWKSGFVKERIDAFLKTFPEIYEAKTIHYDAFFARTSPKEGITLEDDKRAIRQIVDYWHGKGIDVTTEFISSDDMIGWFPMIWHNNLDEFQRLQYPLDVVCGGDDEWNRSLQIDYYSHDWREHIPRAGCYFEEAWGVGHWGDMKPADLDRGRMVRNLFRTAFLFAWYNRRDVLGVSLTADDYTVTRAGGVVANVRIKDRHLTVKEKGRTVVDGTDYFLDMPYGNGTLLVHSLKGCDRSFELPGDWQTTARFEGVRHPAGKPVSLVPDQGRLRVTLAPGESLTLHKR